MTIIFIDEGDHSFLNSFSKTFINYSFTQGSKLDIRRQHDHCICIIYKTKKNNDIVLVIVDYFGCTEVSPKEIITSFNDECLCGKGIGKLLINMIQVISNILCNDKIMSLCPNAQMNSSHTTSYLILNR